MKPVALHAALGDHARQRERLRKRGLSAMKGGVEARDLRQRRRVRGDDAHRRDVVRLMQGRQRDQALERGQHRRVDPDRHDEVAAAVNDAVAHSGKATGSRIRDPEIRADTRSRRRG